MTKAAGFFTAPPAFELPHPVVPPRLILATHEAIAAAFEILRETSSFPLERALEDEITRRIHAILEDELLTNKDIPGFDRRRFRNVVRAPEISNHDGTHPAKKPDLIFFLLNRENWRYQSSQDGIFAECKPVDDAHPIGKHYCDSGIMRFVDGDYAWAMQDGLMVAYVRGKRTVPRDLAPVLSAEARHTRLGKPTSPELTSEGVPNLHQTRHARSFAWPEGRQASPITLFHSWHNCD